MSAHAVAHDANARTVELFERGENGLGQLLGDIAVHFVSLRPGFFGGVDVETGAGAKVVSLIFALNLETSCLRETKA